MQRLALILLVLAAMAAPAAAQVAAPEGRVRSLVNEARVAAGVAPLRHSPALDASARRYARSLLRRGVLAHGTRIAAPRRFTLLGENLALVGGRRPRPAVAVRLWLGSPAHRAVMLHRGMREMGVGRAGGSFRGRAATVWVLHLGTAQLSR